MKKQFKTTVLAIALLATVTGAFAADISNALSGKKLVAYSWQKFDRTTGLATGSPVIGTEVNPFPEDCTNETFQVCAIGTPLESGDQIVLRYNQL